METMTAKNEERSGRGHREKNAAKRIADVHPLKQVMLPTTICIEFRICESDFTFSRRVNDRRANLETNSNLSTHH
jgi:hypothetical protein